MPIATLAQCAAWAALTFVFGVLVASLGWFGAGLCFPLLIAFLVAEEMLIGGRA